MLLRKACQRRTLAPQFDKKLLFSFQNDCDFILYHSTNNKGKGKEGGGGGGGTWRRFLHQTRTQCRYQSLLLISKKRSPSLSKRVAETME
jgi:hypothetical protein